MSNNSNKDCHFIDKLVIISVPIIRNTALDEMFRGVPTICHVIVTGSKQFPDENIYFAAGINYPNTIYSMSESLLNYHINVGDGLEVRIEGTRIIGILNRSVHVYDNIRNLLFSTEAIVMRDKIQTTNEKYQLNISDDGNLYTPSNQVQKVHFKMVVIPKEKRVLMLAVLMRNDYEFMNNAQDRARQQIQGLQQNRQNPQANQRARSQSRPRYGNQPQNDRANGLAQPTAISRMTNTMSSIVVSDGMSAPRAPTRVTNSRSMISPQFLHEVVQNPTSLPQNITQAPPTYSDAVNYPLLLPAMMTQNFAEVSKQEAREAWNRLRVYLENRTDLDKTYVEKITIISQYFS